MRPYLIIVFSWAALFGCARQSAHLPAAVHPVWRCYALTPDRTNAAFLPSNITLGADSDRSGWNVASVHFESPARTQPLTLMAHWNRPAPESITVIWPVLGREFGMAGILSARLTADSLIGQANLATDMGPMRDPIIVHGRLSCSAGA